MRKSGGNDEAEVTVHSKNPSNIIMRGGAEVPTVKLIIDGLLFSVKMEDVKASLEKKGVNVLGKMFFDRAWRADKTLSVGKWSPILLYIRTVHLQTFVKINLNWGLHSLSLVQRNVKGGKKMLGL